MVLCLFDGVLWVLFKPPGENVPNNLKDGSRFVHRETNMAAKSNIQQGGYRGDQAPTAGQGLAGSIPGWQVAKRRWRVSPPTEDHLAVSQSRTGE